MKITCADCGQPVRKKVARRQLASHVRPTGDDEYIPTLLNRDALPGLQPLGHPDDVAVYGHWRPATAPCPGSGAWATGSTSAPSSFA
jgi:hypothetical protein